MRLALIAVLSLATTSLALAETVTYVCVEERSVGWEPREGAADVVGRFAPSTSAKLMKFTLPKIEDGKIVRLGELAVTEDGKTYTYVSSECGDIIAYALSDRAFGGTDDLDYYLKMCAERFAPDAFLRDVQFGTGMIRYYFTGDPATRATPIQFTSSLNMGVSSVYASRGTCTLAE